MAIFDLTGERFARLIYLSVCLSFAVPTGSLYGLDEHADSKLPGDTFRQIKEAVKAGEISKQQARAKLQILKKQRASAANTSKQAANKTANTQLVNIWDELQALVKAGQMSSEDANAAMRMIKQRVVVDTAAAKAAKGETRVKPSADDLYKQIEAAVIAGEITKQQAQAKLKALQQFGSSEKKSAAVGQQKASEATREKDHAAYLEAVWAKLQDAVAAGKMTAAQAEAKMTAIKKQRGK